MTASRNCGCPLGDAHSGHRARSGLLGSTTDGRIRSSLDEVDGSESDHAGANESTEKTLSLSRAAAFCGGRLSACAVLTRPHREICCGSGRGVRPGNAERFRFVAARDRAAVVVARYEDRPALQARPKDALAARVEVVAVDERDGWRPHRPRFTATTRPACTCQQRCGCTRYVDGTLCRLGSLTL